MAYTLIGKQGQLILRESDFPQLLRLARFYGWVPEGTERPEHMSRKDWNTKEYLCSEGQLVRDSDAAKLNKALCLSLHDIPDYDCKNSSFTSSILETSFNGDVRKKSSVTNLVRYFSGEDKKKIQEFVEYTGKGGFRIC